MKASTAFLLGLGAAALVLDPDAFAQATAVLEKIVEPVAKASARAVSKEMFKAAMGAKK